jgi:hypothetical protein
MRTHHCLATRTPEWKTPLRPHPPPVALLVHSKQLSIHKDLEHGKQVSIEGWRSRNEALDEIDASKKRHQADD